MINILKINNDVFLIILNYLTDNDFLNLIKTTKILKKELLYKYFFKNNIKILKKYKKIYKKYNITNIQINNISYFK